MRTLALAALLTTACHARLDDGDAATGPDLSRPKQCAVLFDNSNTGGVQGGAVGPTFTLVSGNVLCELWTYHWTSDGSPAGTVGLQNLTTGVTYGPYPAVGTAGQGGKPNVNWDAQLSPRVSLAAGDYQVVDSDPASWSWDDTSIGGFARVRVETGM